MTSSPMHNLTHWRSCNLEGNSCTVETLHYGQDYEKSNVSVLISTTCLKKALKLQFFSITISILKFTLCFKKSVYHVLH